MNDDRAGITCPFKADVPAYAETTGAIETTCSQCGIGPLLMSAGAQGFQAVSGANVFCPKCGIARIRHQERSGDGAILCGPGAAVLARELDLEKHENN